MVTRNLHISKDNKDLGFGRVGDPHLATVQNIVIALVFSTSLKSESIRASTSFRDTETANSVSSETGEILFLELRGSVFADHSVGQGVLHICQIK